MIIIFDTSTLLIAVVSDKLLFLMRSVMLDLLLNGSSSYEGGKRGHLHAPLNIKDNCWNRWNAFFNRDHGARRCFGFIAEVL